MRRRRGPGIVRPWVLRIAAFQLFLHFRIGALPEAAQILRDLGVRTMRLLTNNPRKFVGLEGYGLAVVETLPIEVAASNEFSRRYLKTKKEKLGHTLTGV